MDGSSIDFLLSEPMDYKEGSARAAGVVWLVRK